MDMWTIEFGKYFSVIKATNYSSAICKIHEYIFVDVRYTLKEGKREEFLCCVKLNNIIAESRKEPGNIKYEMLLPIESNNEICISEMWTNPFEQKSHTKTAHYIALTELKAKYVKNVCISGYEIKTIYLSN